MAYADQVTNPLPFFKIAFLSNLFLLLNLLQQQLNLLIKDQEQGWKDIICTSL